MDSRALKLNLQVFAVRRRNRGKSVCSCSVPVPYLELAIPSLAHAVGESGKKGGEEDGEWTVANTIF